MKQKNGKKKRVGLIIGAILLVIVICALVYGFVITKSGYWLVSKIAPESKEQTESFDSANQTVRTIAEEGFVLLENKEHLLPIETSTDKKTSLNLFGIRSIQMVYNGGGSAASDVTKCIKLESALAGEFGNYDLNEDLLNLYYNFYKTGKITVNETSAPDNGSSSEFIENPDNIILDELPTSVWTDTSLFSDGKTILEHARKHSDIAVIVLGRGGNEGMDLSPAELRLTTDESAMVDSVCNAFDNVILILNTANPMEVGFVNDYDSIKSVLWVGYPGESGNVALAEIFNGTVNPSGRISDTWLADNLSTPAANNFIPVNEDGTWAEKDFQYANVPADDNGDEVGYFNQYSEGIYVGYRYFETRYATDSSYSYDDEVVWPFGHGLSYTDFEKKITDMEVDDEKISVSIDVKNTGSVAGKDVIQIYYNPPYSETIEKSAVNLVAFQKTDVIEPGATQNYTIEFAVEDMASYDYKMAQAYVLETGTYEIMLMDDAHTLLASETWELEQPILYNEDNQGKRSTDKVTATNQFADAQGVDDYLTREWNADSRAFTGPQESDYIPSETLLNTIYYSNVTDKELGLTEANLPKTGESLEQTLTLKDMADVPYDDPLWDTFVSQLTIEEMANLVGDGAWHIQGNEKLKIPVSATPDGSTSIAATTYSGAVMGTTGAGVTYPCPQVIASTWNEDIARSMGTSVGTEAQALGYNGWYAPSMNIHRTAFNGRNFEYYSEDPLLSGKIAANVVKGATDKGVICFIKHFAVNERETNCRMRFVVYSNEQALREIYLKPFELAVKEGGSLGVMSSFTYLGEKWCGGNGALLNNVLRDEWGFEGLVITDAAMHPHMEGVQMLQNGGDLVLDVVAAWAGGNNFNQKILAATEENSECRISVIRNLQRASKDILYAVSRTWKNE